MNLTKEPRHGCLTVWLGVMIIANGVSVVVIALYGATIHRIAFEDYPLWVFPVLAVVAVADMICGIAIWKWKKWGFWGFCITTLIVFVVNLGGGMGVEQALLAVVSLFVLYGLLQMGHERNGWSQLRGMQPLR